MTDQNAPKNTTNLSASNKLTESFVGDHTTEAQEQLQHVQPSDTAVQAVTSMQPIPIQSSINTADEDPQISFTLTCCDEAHHAQSKGDKQGGM